jgi:hypothetical protein
MDAYLEGAHRLFYDASPLILKPLNAEMVSAILSCCNKAGVGVGV